MQKKTRRQDVGESANVSSSSASGRGRKPRRTRLKAESLEERILLSATWVDADAVDGFDVDGAGGDLDVDAQLESLDAGVDDLFGAADGGEAEAEAGVADAEPVDDASEGEAGAGDDAGPEPIVLEADPAGGNILIPEPKAGDHFVINGGPGEDTIDLTAFSAGDIEFNDGGFTVATDGGAFTVEHADVEHAAFGDARAEFIDTDASFTSAEGEAVIAVHGDHAVGVGVAGGGEVAWSFDAETGAVDIDGLDGTNAGTTIGLTDHGAADSTFGAVAINGDIGALNSELPIGTLTVTDGAQIGAINVVAEPSTIGTVVLEADTLRGGALAITADVGVIDAPSIMGSLTVNGDVEQVDVGDDIRDGGSLTITGDAGVIDVADDVKGGSSITVGGDVGALSVGDELQSGASVSVTGSIDSIEVEGKLDGSVVVTGDAGSISAGSCNGPVSVAGSLDSFDTTETMKGTIDVGGDAGTISAARFDGGAINVAGSLDALNATAGGNAGDLNAPVTVGGTLGSMTIGDDVHRAVTIGGDAGDITINDDLRDSASITVGGSLSSYTSAGDAAGAITIAGDAGTFTADDLSGHVTIEGNADRFVIADAAKGGSITVGGSLVSVEAGGEVRADISVSANAETISAARFTGGSISVGGDLGLLEAHAEGNAGDLMAPVTVAGDLAAIEIGDDVQGPIHVGGDVGSITINDDLRDRGSIDIQGDLGSYTSGGAIDSSLTVEGRTGAVTAAQLGGHVNLGDDAGPITITNDARGGSLSVAGDLDSLAVGSEARLDITVDGDSGPITAARFSGGSITVAGDAHSVVANGSGNSGDIHAPVTVNGDLGSLHAFDDLHAPITVEGDLGTVRVDDDIRGGAPVNVGGDLGTFTANKAQSSVTVGGDLDRFSVDEFKSRLDAAHVRGDLSIVDGDFRFDESFTDAHVHYAGGSGVVEATDSAPAASLSVGDVTGLEDSAIALPIDVSVVAGADADAAVTVAGVPTGAVLSEGTDSGDGSWTMTVDEAERATLTPPQDFHGEFDLQVTLHVAGDEPSPAVAFEADSISSYGENQDQGGTAVVTDDGAGIALDGNTWKSVPFEYDVSPDTVIEFEFRTDAEGEIHAVGLDDRSEHSPARAMRFAGDQHWGYDAGEYTGDGEWQTIRVNVGEQFTGEADRMFFVNDHDGGGEVRGEFRNIRVFEAGTDDGGEVNDGIEITDTITVTVEDVPDAPTLTALDATGIEDTPIALSIEADSVPGDGSGDVTVTIEGVPETAAIVANVPGTEMGEMDLAAGGTVEVTFEMEEAGYRNSFGFYRIDPDTGTISTPEMAWQNASAQGSGGDLLPGQSSFSFETEPGERVGFFLIANGDRANDYDALGEGTLEFRNADGLPATLDSAAPELVHIAEDGTETVLGGNIYHSPGQSEHTQLNPDNINHTRTTLDNGEGVVTMGFEDLKGGGDRDFDDIVFTMRIGVDNVPPDMPDYTVEKNPDGSWTVGEDALPYISLQPPGNFSGDIELTVTASAEGSPEQSVQTLNVHVVGDADLADLSVSDTSGVEDRATPLDISAAVTDPSETLRVTIAGVPNGASLNAGSPSGDGTWTVDPSDLDGLEFIPPEDFAGIIELDVTATTTDGDDTAEVHATVSVEIDARADVAEISAAFASGSAAAPIELPISIATTDADGSEHFRDIRFRDVPEGVSFNIGERSYSGRDWVFPDGELQDLAVTVPSDSHGQLELELRVVTEEASNGDMHGTRETITVNIEPAVDVVAMDAVGLEDQAIALNIEATLPGGDDVTRAITIGNIPDGATLSAGVVNADGTVTLTPEDLDGLTITPPEHFSGEFELTVEANADTGSEPDPIDFSQTDIGTFVPNQDSDPHVEILDNGGTLKVSGNAWKGIPFDQPITEDTVLEFEFRSTHEGEAHAIGFANGSKLVEEHAFKVFGTQDWGFGTVHNAGGNEQYDGSGEWQKFAIRVGDYFTGDFDTLTFVTDNDVKDSEADSFFRSVTVSDGDAAAVEVSASTNLQVTVTPVADAPTLVAEDGAGLEDSAVPVDIAAALVDPSETLSVTVDGVPDGASLSAGVLNADGSYTLSPDDLAGLTITPPENFSGRIDLDVTATTTDGDSTASSATSLSVDITATADAPNLSLNDATGDEDTPIALDLSAFTTDDSETLSITVRGVPEGAELSAGTLNADGSYTFAPDQLEGLTITPPEHFSGEIDLIVEATSTDTTPAFGSVDLSSDASSTPLSGEWAASDTGLRVADLGRGETGVSLIDGLNNPGDRFEVSTDFAIDRDKGEWANAFVTLNTGSEDRFLFAGARVGANNWVIGEYADGDYRNLVSVPDNIDENELHSMTVSVDDGVVTLSANGRQVAQHEFNEPVSGPVGVAAEYSDTSFSNMSSSASGVQADTATTSGTLTVTVTPVADTPTLGTADADGLEDTPIALDIAAATPDDSETLGVVLRGVPDGATLSAGSPTADGGYALTAEELSGLTITPSKDFSGVMRIEATAITEDGLDTAETTRAFSVTVNPDADAPTLTVADVTGVEDNPVPLTIAASSVDDSETVNVTIRGVPSDATLSAGVRLDNGDYRIGSDQLSGLTLTPPTNFSGDLHLIIDAHSVDGESVAMTSNAFTVHVEPDADTPMLDAADAAGDEDTAIAIPISAVPTDPSEHVAVTVTGLPAGATLSAGSAHADGSWSVDPAELDGLTLNPPKDFSGEITLSITAHSFDGDDTAVATTAINVDVNAVADAPVLTVSSAFAEQDTAVPLAIDAALTDSSETLSVTIAGLPSGATLNAGSGNADGTWTVPTDALPTLQLYPSQGAHGTIELVVTATSTDGEDAASVSATMTVEIAQAPTVVESVQPVPGQSEFADNADSEIWSDSDFDAIAGPPEVEHTLDDLDRQLGELVDPSLQDLPGGLSFVSEITPTEPATVDGGDLIPPITPPTFESSAPAVGPPLEDSETRSSTTASTSSADGPISNEEQTRTAPTAEGGLFATIWGLVRSLGRPGGDNTDSTKDSGHARR